MREVAGPILVTNPVDDEVFGRFARMLVEDGVTTVGELEGRLRVVYPDVVVHARELAGEQLVVWYVYREGRWVRSRTSDTEQTEDALDARRGARSPSHGRIDTSRHATDRQPREREVEP
jgi:hypothetical protein